MAKEEGIEVEGTVIKAERGLFLVEVDSESETKHIIKAHIGGKLRKHYIKVIPGDRVTVEVSAYDLTRGRIIFRAK